MFVDMYVHEQVHMQVANRCVCRPAVGVCVCRPAVGALLHQASHLTGSPTGSVAH